MNITRFLVNVSHVIVIVSIYRFLGYERVYLPLCEVADTPFHIQGDELHVACLFIMLFAYG